MNKSTQPHRIKQGGRIDRARVIKFTYDGRQYTGYAGDTLASALLANGVRVVARSFKYHRPRGVFAAGAEEPNALVQLERGAHTEANRRATEVELYDGLIARSQNCWPSVNFDVGALSAKLSRYLPAGFYYKTFMWPRNFWPVYEKWIRKAAGLGRAPTVPDPSCYDKLHSHCDVLVVGGGVAGLQAACIAARSGARVLLVDENADFGGQLRLDNRTIDGQPAMQWVDARVAEINDASQSRALNRTTLCGYYDYNFLIANERLAHHRIAEKPRERLWKIRAKQTILATGAIERPLVFADNDRPGVMLASALRMYINHFGVLPARRVTVLTNNDSAYQCALDVQRVGGEVTIVDVRQSPNGEWARRARDAGIVLHDNCTIADVDYKRGAIRGITLMRLSQDGASVDKAAPRIRVQCEIIASSGGWTPSVQLFSQGKGALTFDKTLHAFVPATSRTAADAANQAECIGACNGANAFDECIAQGAAAGAFAARQCGFETDTDTVPPTIDFDSPAEQPMRPLWVLPCAHPIGVGAKKHFHELQNDSTIADLALALREGFGAVEHLKRYTTTGMGTDQGKTSNLNALAALADLRGAPIDTLGITTFRPPYTPLTFGAIVGQERRDLFIQKRTTPMHQWHEANGAVYEDVGDWKRPMYFPQTGEDVHAAVRRECETVRNAVGLLDASTLGKIDVRGENAVDLLNIVYTNKWNRLQPGRCRYGLMLNEHGMVFDDGVTTCLGEQHYHMTTTTGGAARVLSHLDEWLQTESPQWRAYCTSVTEQWAVASLNGPKSREVLSALCDAPLDNESFPFMSMRELTVAGIAARVFRISFTGELAYEINVPARFGLALWHALMRAGKPHGICAYGTEAMHVLRAEKGFIIVGQETDGTVTPADLSMDWIVSPSKPDFIGKRSQLRSDTSRNGRKQLVGLLSESPNTVLPEGAHIVREFTRKPPMKMLGHITSSYYSPACGRAIALALIKDGATRKGETVEVALTDGTMRRAIICDSVFYDADGARARG